MDKVIAGALLTLFALLFAASTLVHRYRTRRRDRRDRRRLSGYQARHPGAPVTTRQYEVAYEPRHAVPEGEEGTES